MTHATSRFLGRRPRRPLIEQGLIATLISVLILVASPTAGQSPIGAVKTSTALSALAVTNT